jgi:hypothetical protein
VDVGPSEPWSRLKDVDPRTGALDQVNARKWLKLALTQCPLKAAMNQSNQIAPCQMIQARDSAGPCFLNHQQNASTARYLLSNMQIKCWSFPRPIRLVGRRPNNLAVFSPEN